MEQRKITWQNFPVTEATAVQKQINRIDEVCHFEFAGEIFAADVHAFLVELEVKT